MTALLVPAFSFAQDDSEGASDGTAHVARVLITPAEVAARLDQDLAGWRERIAHGHPRIYFTAETWAGLRARYAAAQGRDRELFDAVIARAREVAEKPVKAYRPPEELVTAKNALPSAQAELWQRPIGDDMVNSSLALALTDDADIREKLRATVLAACGYPNWGLRSRGMHLAAAHVARGIAIAYDWHPGMWSDAEKDTIRKAMRYHVGDMLDGLYGKVFWALSYHNNHNHVSVAGLGLAGLAFLDEIPEAAEWLAAAQINFERVIPYNSPDGSTPEGLSYWTYSFNFITQYIEGTRAVVGSDALYRHPFLSNAISYRLHGSTSGFSAPLPWGATGGPASGPHILYALARQYRDVGGQYLADRSPPETNGVIPATIAWQALWRDSTLPAEPPVVRDHHAVNSDIVTTRNGWTKGDYVLSIKSGVNNRNHGHLDAGALAFAYGDDWLLTAPRYGSGKSDGTGGYWERGGRTGGGRRWTYFSTTTEGHSALLINGNNQRSDTAARGTIDVFKVEDDWVWTSVDLSQAYADVTQARREVLHRRGDYVLVFDNVKLSAPGRVEWLAQVPPVGTAEGGSVTVPGATGSLEIRAVYPAKATFAPRAHTVAHFDLPVDRLKTLALSQEGGDARYVVALLPAPDGASTPVRGITTQETRAGFSITVEGAGWTDHVTFAAGKVRAVRTTGANAAPAFVAERR